MLFLSLYEKEGMASENIKPVRSFLSGTEVGLRSEPGIATEKTGYMIFSPSEAVEKLYDKQKEKLAAIKSFSECFFKNILLSCMNFYNRGYNYIYCNNW